VARPCNPNTRPEPEDLGSFRAVSSAQHTIRVKKYLPAIVHQSWSLVDESESAQRKLKLGFAGSQVMWARCIFRPFKLTLSLGPEAEADIPVYS